MRKSIEEEAENDEEDPLGFSSSQSVRQTARTGGSDTMEHVGDEPPASSQRQNCKLITADLATRPRAQRWKAVMIPKRAATIGRISRRKIY